MTTIRAIVTLAMMSLSPETLSAGNTLTAFDDKTPDLGWQVVNDNVMGGRSVGDFRTQSGILYFTGATNTNGGGFSSIRSARGSVSIDSAKGIRIKVLGDGRTYTFRLESNRGIAYWADFKTSGDADWQTVDIPLTAFIPRWRGMRLPAPAPTAEMIDSIGLMIYDKNDGPFQLWVDRIEVY